MNDQKPIKILSDAALRALEEAKARRKIEEERALEIKGQEIKGQEINGQEINGRGGLDPVRYGDWEKKGLAIDF